MNILLTNESKRHYTLNFKLILPSGQELKGLYRESKEHRRKYYAVIKSDDVKEGELLFFDIIFPIGNGEKEGKNIPFALVLYIWEGSKLVRVKGYIDYISKTEESKYILMNSV